MTWFAGLVGETGEGRGQLYGPVGSTLIQDRVASFGACRGVVFGNYGEASRDVHTLIHVAAKRLETKHWRLLGARSQGEVHGFYVAQLRRQPVDWQAAPSRHFLL